LAICQMIDRKDLQNMSNKFSGLNRNWYLFALLVAVIVLGVVFVGTPSRLGKAAGTIVVNTTEDNLKNDGSCTLREAIISANKDAPSGSKKNECSAGSGADVIEFKLLKPGPYIFTLTRTDSGNEDSSSTGDLDVWSDITILGGTNNVVIQGQESGFTDRVIHILSGKVTISGLTIRTGNVNGDGGAIFNAGELTLTGVTVKDSKASNNGGGMYNAPGGILVVNKSTISNNTATNNGGGVNAFGGTVTLTNSTLSGNVSNNDGGGLSSRATTTLNNVTIANNTADKNGDGSGNAGGLRIFDGAFSLNNTIVAGNAVANQNPGNSLDCLGTSSAGGYNLIQTDNGCTLAGNGNLKGIDPKLSPLQNNGGPTLTHYLLAGSSAIDVGSTSSCSGSSDQRGNGFLRPRGAACDMGAIEIQDPIQSGPVFTVNTNQDGDDGVCSYYDCSFREAIQAANSRANTANSPDQIVFAISDSGSGAIGVLSPLPEAEDPVVIEGNRLIKLDGSGAGDNTDGLVIIGGQTTISGLEIVNFSGNGIRLEDGDGNLIEGNTITNNGGSGVSVQTGSINNELTNNDIYANGSLAIDLGGDGHTANDNGDGDGGGNYQQNYPILIRAIANTNGSITVNGLLNSVANQDYTLELYGSEVCSLEGNGSQTSLGTEIATTDGSGNAYFILENLAVNSVPKFINATATDSAGNTSEYSDCISVGPGNISWPEALVLPVQGGAASIQQYVDQFGQSRWYKFEVQPNSDLIVTLTNLPDNYDLTVYKDIWDAYEQLTSESSPDLERLGVEFAPAAFSPAAFSPAAFSPATFSPAAFSPAAFSPAAFSPAAFSPAAFSPAAFSPAAFSPAAFSPAAFSPAAFSPDAISPAAFSPAAFSPAAFSPAAFSPAAFSPAAFSPAAFSSAQMSSLIGVSAFEGTAGEGLVLKTWNNTGDFYIRVRGREGAFSLDSPFQLDVQLMPGSCGSVTPITTPSTLIAEEGGYETLILIDSTRMSWTSELDGLLGIFSQRQEVNGIVVDVGQDERIKAANLQADEKYDCPYAKNLAAGTIKEIVDAYWELNPLKYVVIVGADNVIPFFRHPDRAYLGPEEQYVPPVKDNTASQASLRLNYVLSQDDYGSKFDISVKETSFPIPSLAVGRLVETYDEIKNMLEVYNASTGILNPESSFVSGYDFLEDAATRVSTEFEAGIGIAPDKLIDSRNISPEDPSAWTADELRTKLLGSRHDLIFLAGHFSAVSALAADYKTQMVTTDLVNSDVNLENALVFSAGCHSGYNIINPDGIPGVTFEPDWAQAFARKGATLVAGTGYQYGDTDFLEYSERLYLEFAKQLRVPNGSNGHDPVAVGEALVAAKQAYLAATPLLRGIHEKALLEATLFGFPMLQVNLNNRSSLASKNSIVGNPTQYQTEPGNSLGLGYADVTVSTTLTQHTVILTDTETIGSNNVETVEALYFEGGDGVLANPVEPVLPLEVRNVAVVDNVLRGVGFRGGSYTDELNVLPLTGAATTEIRGVHIPFITDVFYPVQPWNLNYFATLNGSGTGATWLNMTSAQYLTDPVDPEKGTMRTFSAMDFRLYYSNYTQTTGESAPALAAAPAIVSVSGIPDQNLVNFSANVVGNPAAGVQEVWVTYTVCPESGSCNGQWLSVDLVQDVNDSTLWTGTLDLNTVNAEDVRYIVQAVNGVGLVSMATNLGVYYIPGIEGSQQSETSLSLEPPPASGPYGTQATFSAIFKDASESPLPDRRVVFSMGGQARQAVTDSQGRATASLPLLSLPGDYEVTVFFNGTVDLLPSSASSAFKIVKQTTSITSEDSNPINRTRSDDVLVNVTLQDDSERRLGEFTVFFVVDQQGSSQSWCVPVITDYQGRASLKSLPLGVGTYDVMAYYNGTIPNCGGNSLTLDDDRYKPSFFTTTLTIVNRAPEAIDDTVSVDEDNTLSVAASGVLANDSDPDGDALTAIFVSGPSNGTLALNADGSFTYTPTANFNGTDSFIYKANDGFDNSNEATVMITVNPVNDAPTADDQSVTTDEDLPVPISLIASDMDEDSLTYSIISGPSHGTLTGAAADLTYSPTENYYGSDSFTFKVNDGMVDSNIATVSIEVNPVDDPPDCSTAKSSYGDWIWPPNNNVFVPVQVINVVDPVEGDPVTITITGVYQDEPVNGDFFPDAELVDSNGDGNIDTAKLRAERDGSGDGRVYHIYFTATDSGGASCSNQPPPMKSKIRVGVSGNQGGGLDPIDQGPLYDSTIP
jgi:CSLREA domain-containing protein